MNKEEIFLTEAYIHYNYFSNIARKLTQNEFDADDLTQDTFIRAYRFIHQFEPGSNCKAWLYRIMKNLFINMSKKKQAHPHSDLDSIHFEPVEHISEPELQYYEIMKQLQKIKDEYRTVILLYHLKECTLLEISKTLNCPIGTVKSRLHRARIKFREVLSELK